jgi:hypothetical protein
MRLKKHLPQRRPPRTRRRFVRLSFGHPYRRLTLSRHGITLSLGMERSGLRGVWTRSWQHLWRDAGRLRQCWMRSSDAHAHSADNRTT